MNKYLFTLPAAVVAILALPQGSITAHDDTEKMCHEGQTIEVPNEEVATHLAHGDTDGKCVPTTSPPTTTTVPATTAPPTTTTTTVEVGPPPTVPPTTPTGVPVECPDGMVPGDQGCYVPQPPIVSAPPPVCSEPLVLIVDIGGLYKCVVPTTTTTGPCLMAIPPFETQECELPTAASATNPPPAQPTQTLPSTGTGWTWILAGVAGSLTAVGTILRRMVR